MTRKGSAASLLIVGLGAIPIVLGFGMLGIDASNAIDSGVWRSDSLLDLLTSPQVRPMLLEDFAAWLEHPRSLKDLHPPVVFLLDSIAQWFVCLGVGGLIVWRGLR